MLRASRLLRLCLACGCVSLCGMAHASGDLLGGALDRWLESEAGPALAETLSRHPRFKGETVRVVAMHEGKPAAASNALAQAVQQRLTQQLLRASGVRIAWGDGRQECAVPRAVPLLLGIEIEPAGAASYRLHLGVVDVQEGVWVSGVSHTWEGRLPLAAESAFRRTVQVGTPGSMQNPLPVARRQQVADMLRAGFGCALPSGLDGAVFVTPGSEAGLNPVARALAGDLSKSPLITVTTERAGAEWLLSLQAQPAGGAHELFLMLNDARGLRAPQQLASLMVTGVATATTATTVATAAPAPTQASAQTALLSPLWLRAADREGICRHDDACVEVGFRLRQPAYVLVLSSESRRLAPRSCGRGIGQSRPGERWFRVRVARKAHGPMRPDAGFYVLAIEQRSVADRLAAHLRRLCTPASGPAGMTQWLAELERLLQGAKHAVTWRSVHLRHTATGIVRL